MSRFRVTNEMKAWLKEQYPQLTIEALTVAFNHRFDTDKTSAQVKAMVKNHRITCSRKQGEITKGRYFSYSQEQAEFIKTGYQQWTLAELTRQFNQRFGTEKTESQIRSFTRNHGIKSGRSGRFEKGNVPFNAGTKGVMKANSGSFQKGMKPHNHKPVGSERVNVEGYVEIKTAEPNVWELKQRVIYAEHFGDIPDGHNVRFRDGDRQNCAPDNLFLVNNHENVMLNQRYKLNSQPIEVRDTLVLLARLDVKTQHLESQGDSNEQR
ncbi:HNH endonuclease signature motif containing protein [Vibrio harveyi]